MAAPERYRGRRPYMAHPSRGNELKQVGLAPRAMKLGTRRIINVEEAQKWCRERTEASGNVVREARQP